jgi:hypothetical protein
VEAGVLLAQRWILARLRNRVFYDLRMLNEAISELLEELSNRPFKKLEGCRRSLFESADWPAMKPLHGGQRVASQARNYGRKGSATTCNDHRRLEPGTTATSLGACDPAEPAARS